MTEWINRNPFTNDYVREEVAFYGVQAYDKNGITLTMQNPRGAINDLFNKYWAIGGDFPNPHLRIDGRTWMSLTRMECQSQHLPIQYSKGKVGTVGLGMGHYTSRVMAKDDVTSLIVFERDPRVIAFFKDNFKDRKGFEKVIFIEGDARELCKGYAFDFLYVDCYPTLCSEDVISDCLLFTKNNNLTHDVDSYHFWGLEKVMLEAVQRGLVSMWDIRPTMIRLFQQWEQTPVGGQSDTTLGQMYNPVLEDDYLKAVLGVLGYRKN